MQTAYLIAEVIAIPLSGFLSRALGTRLLFAISAAGFTIASLFCGFASTIEQMILWRAIQGFLGAGMIPTVFASAYTVFPRSKFHIVGPIIGLVATLAPTIGPTVGGIITDWMSWHWLFFINIVPGIGITIGVLVLVDFDEPNFELLDHFDWWGLLFMAGFLGSLEYVLEEGPQYEWLQDTSIAVCAAICAVSAIAFFWRVLTAEEPIVDITDVHRPQFRHRLPDLVLRRHRPLRPDLHVSALSRRSARLQRADDRRDHVRLRHHHVPDRADRRPADAEGRHALDHRAGLVDVRARLLADDLDHPGLRFLRTARAADPARRRHDVAMVPTNNIALGTLPPDRVKNASGLFNLTRNLGGAVGLAVINPVLNERTDLHIARLQERVTLGQRHRDRDAQHVDPADAGHGRRLADGDEAAVADRAPPGGGDGLWRRLLHADGVLFRPQPAGDAAEEAAPALLSEPDISGSLTRPALLILPKLRDAFISGASLLEPGRICMISMYSQIAPSRPKLLRMPAPPSGANSASIDRA